MRERRRCQRVTPSGRLHARVKCCSDALVVNLSPHGVLLEVAMPLVPGSERTVSLDLFQGRLVLQGAVRRCRAVAGGSGQGLVFRAGLEFVSPGTRQQQLLQDTLVDLCLGELTGTRPATGSAVGHAGPALAPPCYKEGS
jgi:hypothetical protein